MRLFEILKGTVDEIQLQYNEFIKKYPDAEISHIEEYKGVFTAILFYDKPIERF